MARGEFAHSSSMGAKPSHDSDTMVGCAHSTMGDSDTRPRPVTSEGITIELRYHFSAERLLRGW